MECRTRDYEVERLRRKPLQTKNVSKHPLMSTNVVVKQSKTTVISNPLMDASADEKAQHSTKMLATSNKSVFVDPLSSFQDPLSSFQAEQSNSISKELPSNKKTSKVAGLVDGWQEWRTAILATFTTTQKLSLHIESRGEVTVAEKVRNQLQQLEWLEEGTVATSMTQQEYTSHLLHLSSSLQQAWKEDQRVRTLKLAIQATKLLADTSTPSFYPSKFVLIVDLLTTFSSLVFHRLLKKSSSSAPSRTSSASSSSSSLSTLNEMESIFETKVSSDVTSEQAKETCRNWLYKVASIRELLPRLYLEASLVVCLGFLSQHGGLFSLHRLLLSCRGVADALVSVYLRCYLVRMVDLTSSSSSSQLPSSASSSNTSLSSLAAGALQTDPFTFSSLTPPLPSSLTLLAITDSISSLCNSRLLHQSHLSFFSPAFNWLFKCHLRANQNEGNQVKAVSDLFSLVAKCDEDSVKSLLIGCLIDQSPASFIAERCMELDAMVAEVEGGKLCSSVPELLTKLGACLGRLGGGGGGGGGGTDSRRELLRSVWVRMTAFEGLQEYVACVRVWAVYVAEHLNGKEVAVVMKHIVAKISPQRAFEHYQADLSGILLTLLSCKHSTMQQLLVSPHFSAFLNIITSLPHKTNLCKDALTLFLQQNRCDHNSATTTTTTTATTTTTTRTSTSTTSSSISDPLLIHSLLTLCKALHDPLSAVSLDDDVREAGALIIQVINLINTNSPDSQLTFYVQCRASFCNIDSVIFYLVHKVNTLQSTLREGGRASLCRACSAFSFISIPSLNSPFHRISLSLSSASTALTTSCLAQASDFVDFAIDVIAGIPRFIEVDKKAHHTEKTSLQCIKQLLSLLVLVPDPPHLPPLSHFRHLSDVITAYDWDPSRDTKAQVLTHILVALATSHQTHLPYHIDHLVSNDDLYASDARFLREVSKMASDLTHQLLPLLQPTSLPQQTIGHLLNLIVGHLLPSSALCQHLLSLMGTHPSPLYLTRLKQLSLPPSTTTS